MNFWGCAKIRGAKIKGAKIKGARKFKGIRYSLNFSYFWPYLEEMADF